MQRCSGIDNELMSVETRVVKPCVGLTAGFLLHIIENSVYLSYDFHDVGDRYIFPNFEFVLRIFELIDREDFINISLHPALVLRPSLIPAKVDVNQIGINQKYSHEQ
jgi:hypothetical protein